MVAPTPPLVLVTVAAAAVAAVEGLQRLAPRVLAARASVLRWGAVGVAAAAAGLTAPGSPTGLAVADGLYRAALAGLVALFAARSRRTSWLVAAGIAAATASRPWDAVAFALLGVAVAAGFRHLRWGPVAGAAWGAVLAQVLLRLDRPHAVGATAALAAVAVAVLGVSWYGVGHRSTRRWTRRVLAGVGATLVVLTALFAVVLLGARQRVTSGIEAGDRGLASARAGDVDVARGQLASSAASLDRAAHMLGRWWVQPARVLPVAGRILFDAHAMSAAAADGADAAAALARTAADPAFRVHDGRVNLDLVHDAAVRLRRATRALADAQRVIAAPDAAPWLPGFVTRRLDTLGERLADATDDARTALAAADVAPELLGQDGPRRWFLAVQTPVELRGAGGFIGNYGELVADRGAIRIVHFGRISELYPTGDLPHLDVETAAALARYRGFDVTRWPQNAFQSPDFPTGATALEEVYRQRTGRPVDGVISIDPIGLAALLKVTGAVRVAGWPEPITADNAARILMFDQYVRFADASTIDRVGFLGEVAHSVVTRLTEGELASPGELARALGPVLAGKHLILHAAEPVAERTLQDLRVGGALPDPQGGDFVEVVTQDTTESKIDWFLRRRLRYDVAFDPRTGAVDATLEIRLVNDAPADGLPPYVIGGHPSGDYPPAGHNRLRFAVYSVLDLRGATLDGRRFTLGRETEVGRKAYTGFVTVPPRSTSVVRLRLSGRVAPTPSYRLVVGAQPLVTPDGLTVAARRIGERAAVIAHSSPLIGDTRVRVPMR